MNVLISGNLSSLSRTFAKSFLKERYKVVLVGSNAEHLKSTLPDVVIHSVSPSVEHYQEIISAYKFDAAVYLATREEQLLVGGPGDAGQMLDGLLNTLELCRKESIDKFFYISSTEVYGAQEQTSETLDLQPATPNGFTLKAGEAYCHHYSNAYGLSATVVRVPFIYGEGENNTLLHDILEKCVYREKVVFPAPDDAQCSFLHAEDVADFLLAALDEPNRGFQIVNLSSADPLAFGELAVMLRESFPEGKFEFEPKPRIFTRPAEVSTAKRLMDWIAERKLADEWLKCLDEVRSEPIKKLTVLDRVKTRYPRYQRFLRWFEITLGAVVMHYLSNLSGPTIEFRFVDVRLAFVILFGAVYGTPMGLIAAAFASISILISWTQLNYTWSELIYNVSNWLPFALYLTAGVLSGYFHDKRENDSKHQEQQISLIKEKYTFLYDLYQEVSQLKNQFHRQLVGSRDSFGRIFTIVRDLDTLEEEEVIFKALNILEDVMDNQNVAIYSINQANCYARLEIYSSGLSGKIKKSLNLRDLPELIESVEKGEIFQNSAMKPGYPAYFAPIQSDNATTAAVVIWNASFEQYSLYYYNLLKVICGLVQSSINRVAVFMNANGDRYYVPHTKILQPEPFGRVLKVKNKVKKNKLGDYLLLAVCEDQNTEAKRDWKEVYSLIAQETRAEDYIGLLENGNCYILFSQADHTNASTILNRLTMRGVSCQVVTDQYALLKELPVDGKSYHAFTPVSAATD